VSLPDPPMRWLEANGYSGYLSDERRRQARAAYAYEREHGPPPEPFPAGSLGAKQWQFQGGDPEAVALTTTRKES
jgi:hypothetical protein